MRELSNEETITLMNKASQPILPQTVRSVLNILVHIALVAVVGLVIVINGASVFLVACLLWNLLAVGFNLVRFEK
jgi:hypothetical protein